MRAAVRFIGRASVLTGRSVLALAVTAVVLPVSLPIGVLSYRALRRALRRKGKDLEFFQAVGVGLGTVGFTLPLKAIQTVYDDWGEAISDLRASRSKSFL